ncbi:ubiquitin-like protein 7 [Cloeon dipterum]|uniref:ubiquitin-like protein 7 n=1 Tax=Cloeon dipterum TaxID=197152 RepID=UPI0032208A94
MDFQNKAVLSIRVPLDSSCVLREVLFGSAGAVQDLRSAVARETAMDADTINLIFRGLIMRDGKAVSSYGFRSGDLIHVFAKKQPMETAANKTHVSDEDASRIALSLKSLKQTIVRLGKSDTSLVERLTAAIPSLNDDPVALSILREPDLVAHLADTEVLKKARHSHPRLVEAAEYLAAHLTEFSKNEASNSDDMETDDSPRQQPQAPQRPITGNQLAAALASAISGVSRARQTPPQRLFTPEMLNSALAQAFQSVPSLASSPAAPSAVPAVTPGPSVEQWTQQLQQMREVGLMDDNLNRQMLEITNGDVQAAIDLVIQSQQN